MLDVALRWWKDGLFDPVARLLPAVVTPGHITLVTFVLWAVVLRGSDKPNTQAYERLSLVGQLLSRLS